MGGTSQLPVEFRSAEIRIEFPNGKMGHQLINMIYHPNSELFWWQYTNIPPGMKLADVEKLQQVYNLQLTRDKIVGFTCSFSVIRVIASDQTASSLDEGQSRILREIQDHAEVQQADSSPLFREINLKTALGYDFIALKGSASPFPMPVLRDVKWKEGHWELLLDGPNKDSAKVMLSDDDYRVLGVQHFPPK